MHSLLSEQKAINFADRILDWYTNFEKCNVNATMHNDYLRHTTSCPLTVGHINGYHTLQYPYTHLYHVINKVGSSYIANSNIWISFKVIGVSLWKMSDTVFVASTASLLVNRANSLIRMQFTTPRK